jgi:hypothetical protein
LKKHNGMMSLHLVEALETPYLRWLCFQRAVVGGPELPKTIAATSFPTGAVRSSFTWFSSTLGFGLFAVLLICSVALPV